MSDYPDLNQYGYQIDTQLGCNREGGRITWRGRSLNSQETVIIKQFCFAIAGSSWSGYKAYEQEIKILQQLNHQGIPKYLDGIETKNGFCLIQEYISAVSINKYPRLTTEKVYQVSLELLEILIYLQAQNPPILHRDIKPENILLDEKLNTFLIDFGFASLGSQDVSGSSVFKGTPGFIAPEQIVKPILASDIYSLGITIVCLLSNKSIAEIRDLASADNPYQLNIKPLFPELNRNLVNWLEKMIDAKVSKRFSNASVARESLLSIDLQDSSDSTALLNSNFKINKLNNLASTTVILTTFAVSGLSSTAIWSISFVDRNIDSSVVDLAIAIVAGVVVGITELGAIEIAKIDAQAKLQGGILGIGVPIFLVAISGLIWGREEAVDIAATISLAQLFILSYFWWQMPVLKPRSFKLKFSVLLSAIALGITLGLQLS